ncbi:MAG: patatin-like phospholipase family protein, partial [Candidatus Dormibacteraeota bacterium]|nr:patatin-like phospholipase family protein [Candidatus Dormibacteraeota bacterium]
MRDQGGFGLALGGGGPVGVAWEIGVLLALAEDAGFEPNRAKVIVGTSAGSIVGARLRRGRTPAELLEEQRTRTLPPPELTDPEAFGRFLSLMAEAELPPDERVRRVAE